MARGKHRGCGLLHKWRCIELLEATGNLWWGRHLCIRCGKTKTGMA